MVLRGNVATGLTGMVLGSVGGFWMSLSLAGFLHGVHHGIQ